MAPRVLQPLVALGLAACRPAPVVPATPALPPEPTATEGSAITIVVHDEAIADRRIVGGDGQVDVPLCGPTPVEGATAAVICARVAACLATAIREPFVGVQLDRTPASCTAAGEPPPERDAILDRLAATLPTTSADAELAAELVDVTVDRHVALRRYTEQHPALHRRTERAERLLEALPEGTAPERVALQTHLALRLQEATHTDAELATEYGPNHPRVQDVRRRIAALQRIADAIGGSHEIPEALTFVLAHERALQEDAPMPALATPPCAALDHAFALRIAYWQGRRDAAVDPAHAESILDGLLRARASVCPTR